MPKSMTRIRFRVSANYPVWSIPILAKAYGVGPCKELDGTLSEFFDLEIPTLDCPSLYRQLRKLGIAYQCIG